VCVLLSRLATDFFFYFGVITFTFSLAGRRRENFFFFGNKNDLQLRDLIAKGRVYDVGELVLSLFFLFAFVRSFVQLLNAP
jgi:hypothetical protein